MRLIFPLSRCKSNLINPGPLTDYLALVDWTSRIVRDDKRGALSNKLSAILDRLCIDQQEWFVLVNSNRTLIYQNLVTIVNWCASSIGNANIQTIQDYIRNQG